MLGFVMPNGAVRSETEAVLTEAQRRQRVEAGRASVRARVDPEQAIRLGEIRRTSEARRADRVRPGSDPSFEPAVFRCSFKRATLLPNGGWGVSLDVPYADQDVFYRLVGIMGVEFVMTVRRNPVVLASGLDSTSRQE